MRKLLLIFCLLFCAVSARAQSTIPVCAGTNDTSRFTAIVTAAAGTPRTVEIPRKTAATRCASNTITLPAHLTIDFTNGGITLPAGQTITIQGPIIAPAKQIFFGTGTVSFSGNALLSEVITEWWGAKGDNSTDSGTAINAAIAAVKTMTSGKLKSLGGIYRSTILVTYTGASGSSLIWEGVGQPRGAASGTTIRYTGSVGGTLISWKGANNSTFRDIAFDGGGLALKTVIVDYDSVGGVGSSGVAFENVTITGASGVGSVDLTWGTGTTQVSEIRAYNLTLSGFGSPSLAERGLLTTTSNAKNFMIVGLSCLNYTVAGIEWGGSGTFTLIEPIFALNALDIKRTFSTGGLTIIGGESESGNKFIAGTSAGNPGTTTIVGTYWQGSTAADDYVISDGASIDIRNSEFYNNRTGSSVAKIQTLANNVSPGMLISEGNTFQHATDHAPIYDSSNNDIFSTYITSNTNQWRIRSFGDIGGNVGTLWPKLRPWILDFQAVSYLGGNAGGSVTLATAAFATVTLGTAEPNASYRVLLTGNINETFWVSNLTTTTFRVNSSNATSTAVVNWILVR